MVSCDATKVGANLGREQVQYALSIFRDERIQENSRRTCAGFVSTTPLMIMPA
jgi:hypothetical protein